MLNSLDILDGFFSVCGPEDYNSIDFLFEILDVLAEFLNDLMVSAYEDIIGSFLLIGSDKLGLECGFHRFEFLEIGLELMEK